jgi:microsomal dipeptidase-like Zn-dependent dipeptidase
MEVVKNRPQKNEEEPTVTSKVPRILCEIFVYGLEDDKKKIHLNLSELQKQMEKTRRNKHKIRVCYYLDKGEKSLQQKMEWYKAHGKCKYFVAIQGTEPIAKDFVKNTLSQIRLFENSFKSMKAANIRMFGKSNNPDGIEEAQEVE